MRINNQLLYFYACAVGYFLHTQKHSESMCHTFSSMLILSGMNEIGVSGCTFACTLIFMSFMVLDYYIWKYEPRREKTGFSFMQKQRRRSASVTAKLISAFSCYSDSTIPLFLKSEFSSFQPASVSVQVGLCRSWSETPEDGFLASRLICL